MLVHRAYPSIDWCILAGNVRSSAQLQRIDRGPSQIRVEILYLEQHSFKHGLHRLHIFPSLLVELMKFVFDPLKESDCLVRPSLQSIGRKIRQQSIVVVQAEHYCLSWIQLEDVVEDFLFELVESRNYDWDPQETSVGKRQGAD